MMFEALPCREVRLAQWYKCVAEWHTGPMIKFTYGTISRDEDRHGGAYLQYSKGALAKDRASVAADFAKIG
jgi:hypothetical protein